MPRRKLEDLIKQATALARRYPRVQGSDRTDLLRELAELVVQIRGRFTDLDGAHRDWAGRSWDYRLTMQGVFEGARLDAQINQTLQAALRYHVGNVLRRTVSPEELDALGLLRVSPQQRVRTNRAENAALLQAARAASDDSISPPEAARRAVPRLLRAAARSLEAVQEVWTHLGPSSSPETATEKWDAMEELLTCVERVIATASEHDASRMRVITRRAKQAART